MDVATEIADVFNHVHQSHSDDAPNAEVLADAARQIGAVLEFHGLASAAAFADVASMSGLDVAR